MSPDTTGRPPRLRADAVRNRADIRQAALRVFRERGLTAPLELVAATAGVSKGTIYHRFVGREGLVDAVVDDLARLHIEELIARCETVEDGRRFEEYLDGIWRLQYDEPAVSDVLTRQVPGSTQLTELCERASGALNAYLVLGQAAGRIRAELSGHDVYRFIWERGIVFRTEGRPTADDDERHRRYLLDGLRRR